jgi:hypothetical protein
MKNTAGIISSILFAIGIIISIVAAFVAEQNDIVVIILVIIGVIVGALNIKTKQIVPIMVAAISLIAAGGVFDIMEAISVGELLNDILSLFAVIAAPIAAIMAAKLLWSVGFPGEKSEKS